MKGIFVRKESSSLKFAEKLEFNCGTKNYEVEKVDCFEISEIVKSESDYIIIEQELYQSCFFELSNRLAWYNMNSAAIEIGNRTKSYKVYLLSIANSERVFPVELFCGRIDENRAVDLFRCSLGGVSKTGVPSKVSEFFTKVGLFPNLNGYAYLVEAIKYVNSMPELLRNLTKGLYPLVGKTFGVSGSVVERGIRNAVESMMSKGKFCETANGLYGGNFGKYEKPTNGEFISFLSLMWLALVV